MCRRIELFAQVQSTDVDHVNSLVCLSRCTTGHASCPSGLHLRGLRMEALSLGILAGTD